MRVCRKCLTERDLTDFYASAKHKDGVHPHCSKCQSLRASEWNKKNPLKRRVNSHRNKMKTQYGITPEDLVRMTAEQGGKCLLCELKRKLVVDHCHKTGKVRGLLCRQCNSGIGQLQESEIILRRAIEYVAKNS